MPAATPDTTAVGSRTWLPTTSGPSALVVAMAVVVIMLLAGLTVLLLTGAGAGTAAT
jgi:hypothetical protein